MTRALFRKRLNKAAGLFRHSALADQLGIKRSLLRNWLYRNTPPELAVKALGVKIEQLLKKEERENRIE